MADYIDLFNLFVNSNLRNRTAVAVTVKAQGILDDGSATAAEVAWAIEAIQSPKGKGDNILKYVLAKNKALTTTQISGAVDSALQANVDAAVDAIIAGGS